MKPSKSVGLIKRFYLARINHCLRPSDETQFFLDSIMKEIAESNKPSKFSPGPGNVLVEHQSEFEKLSALVEKNFGVRVKDLTLFEFLSRLESIKEEYRKQSQQAAPPVEKGKGK